jgi:hypothetical protein
MQFDPLAMRKAGAQEIRPSQAIDISLDFRSDGAREERRS